MVRVAVATGLLLAGASGVALSVLGPASPATAQPLAFSHRVHAGAAGIDCTFCHVYAERGPVAGIPSMARCRGCHRFIRENRDDPAMNRELENLQKALESGTAIEWVRVHRLPDHVTFTHQRHVRAGVACRACHGEVEKMEVVVQTAPLLMGWCLECHRQKQAEQPEARARLTECLTCHK